MERTYVKILYQGGTGELVEKKSRFIATVKPIETEEEALDYIAAAKKQYWDASHNCYAFVAGEQQQLQRCSDDGEPAGTAGRPMLEVLLREELHNVLVIVTRYFGGTLLGTGGLVRAYQGAVREGLQGSVIARKEKGCILTIQTDYNGLGKIQYLLAKENIHTMDSVYGEQVELGVMVPTVQYEGLLSGITEATGGRAVLERGEEVEFAEIKGEIVIFQKK